jgi:hypothetical protein
LDAAGNALGAAKRAEETTRGTLQNCDDRPGGSDHSLEMETLGAIGAEIVSGGRRRRIAKAVADADAIYPRPPRITAR